jgi:hypothetical protein
VIWGFVVFFELGAIFTLKNVLIWADRRLPSQVEIGLTLSGK